MSNCPKNVVVKRPSVSFSSICELILLLYWATRCHKQNLVTPTRKSIIEFLFGIGLSIDLCLFPFQIIKARPQIPPSSMATLLATFGISITFQRSPKPLEWGRVGTSLDIGCVRSPLCIEDGARKDTSGFLEEVRTLRMSWSFGCMRDLGPTVL